MINCSLGDDGVPSNEDTCSFSCNTGYELTGSKTRTCQNDKSWSGSTALCRRGQCIPYSAKLWQDKTLADLELQENWWTKFWQLMTLIMISFQTLQYLADKTLADC